ncbi:MAG: hypothetical protein Q8920_00345 [Bacillota bacterium]|nr:hypothetical protein [Bacillota bacterium]
MSQLTLLLFLIIAVSLMAGFIILVLRKGISGVKVMLLGINITLLGGILAVDPNSNLGGFEYLIVLIGLIISIFGLVND